MLNTPIIIVNFKTYSEASGENAVDLAQACENVVSTSGIQIAAAVQAADIFRVSNAVMIPVLAEHIDPIMPGRGTGKITAEDVSKNGAVGVLINHSEDKVDIKVIEDCIKSAAKNGLQTVVCAETVEEVGKISSLRIKPDFIAIEPPELIAGKISISSAKPCLIKDAVARSTVPILAGAGIHGKKDVSVAIKLGAKGILVASAVTLAENPENALKKLAEGFKV